MPKGLTPQEQRKILIALGGALAVLAWLILVLIPVQSSLAGIRPQVIDLKDQLGSLRQGLNQLPAMEEELKRLFAEYELPATNLSPEEQLPQLLENIAQLARASQVRLVAVKPKADLSLLAPGPSGYLELPVQMEASGGYHAIGSFLDAMERSKSLVRVLELQMEPSSEDLWHHQAILILQLYLVPSAGQGVGE
ncbi:MAG: type 4a pilus biogenesis protein PilO [Candidatus Omnitrophica bacterium]|nr:type 4a pilus biogenesis protein PilO [Candidatus Omnitrophota bacterium]